MKIEYWPELGIACETVTFPKLFTTKPLACELGTSPHALTTLSRYVPPMIGSLRGVEPSPNESCTMEWPLSLTSKALERFFKEESFPFPTTNVVRSPSDVIDAGLAVSKLVSCAL